ncbi:hypothetical protein [Longimycelium tulufanense]|nr:hypothetical protein [Longimycelium tulufanense]
MTCVDGGYDLGQARSSPHGVFWSRHDAPADAAASRRVRVV